MLDTLDLVNISEFFNQIYGNREGWFCLPCMDHDNGKWEQSNKHYFYYPDDLEQAVTHMTNENQSGKCVYFTPSLYTASGSTKKESVIENTSLLFADIDENDNPVNIAPQPSTLWETSPGRYQAIWRLKAPVPWDEAEVINQNLTKHIGADPGCWAKNKILRVPGSVNNKKEYERPQRGRLLWNNGPEYSLREIKNSLNISNRYHEIDPVLVRNKIPDNIPSFEEIIEKNKDRIPKATMELLKSTPLSTEEDWSKTLWKIEKELLELGLTIEEAFVLVRGSKWNKYKRDGRPDEHLWNEINKANQPNILTLNSIENKPCAEPGSSLLSPPEGLVMRRVSDIEEEQTSYLWYPYLPKGKLTILEGDPGDGKTFVALNIAACISSGNPLPRDESQVPYESMLDEEAGIVIYMSNEDSFADTLKPRLSGMEANQDLIYSCEGRFDKEGKPLPLTLEDIHTLSEMLSYCKPKLLIIDPIQSYFGSTRDSHKATQVRPVMDGLAKLAEKHQCAILILRHLTKRKSDKAIYRGLDSIDFIAAARSAIQVVWDPENLDHEEAKIKNRVIVHIKASTTGVGSSLRYRIEPNPDSPIKGKFSWNGISNLTTADLNYEEDSDKGRSAVADAKEFLLDNVSRENDGSLAGDIKSQAKKQGIASTTLRRAREDLQKQYESNPEKGGMITTQAYSGNPSQWKIMDPVGQKGI